MPVARTPPLKGSQPPRNREDTFSPSQAFQSHNPGVMHSPMGGGSRSPPRHVEDAMDVDADVEDVPSDVPKAGSPVASGSTAAPKTTTPHDAPTTPPAPAPRPPAPTDDDDTPMAEPEPPRTPPPAVIPTSQNITATTPVQPTTPSRGRARALRLSRAASAALTDDDEPAPPPVTTPGRKDDDPMLRRESRLHRRERARTPAEVLAEPAVPIVDEPQGDAAYGRYYEQLMRTLKVNAVERGLGKLTLEHMKECFPLIEAGKSETMTQVWESLMYKLRSDTLEGSLKLLEHYEVARKLKRFADVVDDAREWAKEHPGEGRPDAWRPDLKPDVITAAVNMGVYDESWACLRNEYILLSKECGERLRAVEAKRALLANVDDGVSVAVAELAKTNELLKGFPSQEMLQWAEDVQAEMR